MPFFGERGVLQPVEVIHSGDRTPCWRDSLPTGLRELGEPSLSAGLRELRQLASPGNWRESVRDPMVSGEPLSRGLSGPVEQGAVSKFKQARELGLGGQCHHQWGC